MGKDVAGRGGQECRGDIGIDRGGQRLAGGGGRGERLEDLRLAAEPVVDQPAQAGVERVNRIAMTGQGAGGADLGQAAGRGHEIGQIAIGGRDQ